MAEQRKFLKMRSAPRTDGPGLGTFLAGSGAGLAGLLADVTGLLIPDTPTVAGGKVEMTPEMMGVTEDEAAQLGQQSRDIVAKGGTEAIARGMGLSEEQINSPEFMLGTFADPLIALGLGKKLAQATKLRGSGIETRGSGDVKTTITDYETGEVREVLPVERQSAFDKVVQGDKTPKTTPVGTRPSGLGAFGVSPPLRLERAQTAFPASSMYSPIELAIENAEEALGLGRKGLTGEQLLSRFKKLPSVTDAELERTGLMTLFKENPSRKGNYIIDKEELRRVYKANAPRIQTQVRSSEDRILDDDGYEIDIDDYNRDDYQVVRYEEEQRLLEPRMDEYREIVYIDINAARGTDMGRAGHYDDTNEIAFAHSRHAVVGYGDQSGFFVEEIQDDIEKLWRDTEGTKDRAVFATPDRAIRAAETQKKLDRTSGMTAARNLGDELAELERQSQAAQKNIETIKDMAAETSLRVGDPRLPNDRATSAYSLTNYATEYDTVKQIEVEGGLQDAQNVFDYVKNNPKATALERAEARIGLEGAQSKLERFMRDQEAQGHKYILGLNAEKYFFGGRPNELGVEFDDFATYRIGTDFPRETPVEQILTDDVIRKNARAYAELYETGVARRDFPEYLPFLEEFFGNFRESTKGKLSPSLQARLIDSFGSNKKAMKDLRDLLNTRRRIEDESFNIEEIARRQGDKAKDLQRSQKVAQNEAGVSVVDIEELAYERPDEYATFAQALTNRGVSAYKTSKPSPPFPDQITSSSYQIRNMVSMAIEEGRDFVIFPNYVDVATVRGGDPKDFKLTYDDAVKKVIKDMKTQFGDDVSVEVINPRDPETGKAAAAFVKGSQLERPMIKLNLSSLQGLKFAPRGYAKGGHVQTGVAGLFALYS